MRTRSHRFGFCGVVLCSLATASLAGGASPIDLRLAKKYFDEAKALSDRDAGKLWGRPLYGPLMFADNATRAIVADRPDKESKLRAEGDVFVGTLPPEFNVANTSFSFAGMKWTMVMWPPPADAPARGLLLMHELWHRIQDEIGFPSTGPANNHLDGFEGRVWMRLEWAALRKALESSGSERKQASADALLFRAIRRSLFEQAAKEEQALEMHEGLANYTGAALAGATVGEQIAGALRELDAGEKKPTYVRSFAYASGPPYGLLLDDLAPDWRKELSPKQDFGGLLATAVGFSPPAHLQVAADERSKRYDADRIVSEETQRERVRQETLAAARAKFVDGPVLRLPFEKMKIKLDPDGIVPLDDLGTVYPTARIVDTWGVLTVTDGALIDKNWSSVTVSAPAEIGAKPLAGAGWVLELSAGWTFAPGIRPGSYTVVRGL